MSVVPTILFAFSVVFAVVFLVLLTYGKTYRRTTKINRTRVFGSHQNRVLSVKKTVNGMRIIVERTTRVGGTLGREICFAVFRLEVTT